MKKFCFVMLLLIALTFSFTSNTHAAEKVKVYLFGFDSCPHCANQYEYLKGLDGYNTKFEVIKKSIYDDDMNPTDNAMLASVVSEYFEEHGSTNSEFIGSPYVVISDLYAASGYNEDLTQYINEAIKLGDKDIVTSLEGKTCSKCLNKETECSKCKDATGKCSCNEQKDATDAQNKNLSNYKEKSNKKYIIIYSLSAMAFVLVVSFVILRKKVK